MSYLIDTDLVSFLRRKGRSIVGVSPLIGSIILRTKRQNGPNRRSAHVERVTLNGSDNNIGRKVRFSGAIFRRTSSKPGETPAIRIGVRDASGFWNKTLAFANKCRCILHWLRDQTGSETASPALSENAGPPASRSDGQGVEAPPALHAGRPGLFGSDWPRPVLSGEKSRERETFIC